MKCYLIFCDDPEKANLHFSVSKLIQGSAGTGLIRSNQNIVKNCKSSCGRAKWAFEIWWKLNQYRLSLIFTTINQHYSFKFQLFPCWAVAAAPLLPRLIVCAAVVLYWNGQLGQQRSLAFVCFNWRLFLWHIQDVATHPAMAIPQSPINYYCNIPSVTAPQQQGQPQTPLWRPPASGNYLQQRGCNHHLSCGSIPASCLYNGDAPAEAATGASYHPALPSYFGTIHNKPSLWFPIWQVGHCFLMVQPQC